MRREGLPEDAPYDEDGYSVPMEYFKYNPDWRRLVREFQEDLGAGRYDPQWIAEATQAMEERSRGDFDQYKEDQYEEFWGQKQKLNSRELAGDSARIKLADLAEHGIIRVGDIFSYTRAIGRKHEEDRILIEKDVRVAKINGPVLTMAIPPGQLKYARHLPTPQVTPAKPAVNHNAAPTVEYNHTVSELKSSSGQQLKPLIENDLDALILEGYKPNEDEKIPKKNMPLTQDIADVAMQTANEDSGTDGQQPNSLHVPAVDAQEDAQKDAALSQPIGQDPDFAKNGNLRQEDTGAIKQDNTLCNGSENPQKIAKPIANDASAPDFPAKMPAPNSTTPTKPSSKCIVPPPQSQGPIEDVIYFEIRALNQLDDRIVDIDGRKRSKDHRSPNSWKIMRGKRNNQDLGSLFEMREEFFVRQDPTIVKMPKQGSETVKPKAVKNSKSPQKMKAKEDAESSSEQPQSESDWEPGTSESARKSKRSKKWKIVEMIESAEGPLAQSKLQELEMEDEMKPKRPRTAKNSKFSNAAGHEDVSEPTGVIPAGDNSMMREDGENQMDEPTSKRKVETLEKVTPEDGNVSEAVDQTVAKETETEPQARVEAPSEMLPSVDQTSTGDTSKDAEECEESKPEKPPSAKKATASRKPRTPKQTKKALNPKSANRDSARGTKTKNTPPLEGPKAQGELTEEFPPKEEAYTSRSGRKTKRRVNYKE